MNTHSFTQQIFSSQQWRKHPKSLPSWSFCSKGQDKQWTINISVVVSAGNRWCIQLSNWEEFNKGRIYQDVGWLQGNQQGMVPNPRITHCEEAHPHLGWTAERRGDHQNPVRAVGRGCDLAQRGHRRGVPWGTEQGGGEKGGEGIWRGKRSI